MTGSIGDGKLRVAIIVDRLQDHQVPVIRGMESVLRTAGVALLVVVSHPLHSRRGALIRRLVQAGRLHGIVVTTVMDAATQRSRVAQTVDLTDGVPVVTMGLRLPGMPAVLSDNVDAVAQMMTHLVEGCGRVRPLLIAGSPDVDDSLERESAFRAVAELRNLELPENPVLQAYFDRENAYRSIGQRLSEGRDFDAVLAVNDDMAMGALDALREHGVRVPEDVALIGYDNTAGAYATDPPLTSVDSQLEGQGQVAARLLLDQLAGRPVPAESRVPARLVIRQSSGERLSSEVSEVAVAALMKGDPDPIANQFASSAVVAERVLAALRSNASPLGPDFSDRLEELGKLWIPSVIDGTLTPERGAELGALLHALVALHPEPLWWRGVTASLQAMLIATSPGGRLAASLQAGILRVALHTDRALATVREQRDRDQLSVSQHVLELNRALSDCQSLAQLTREVSAYLPRLNVRRCFLVLLDTMIDRSGDVPVPERPVAYAHLAMSYRDGVPAVDLDPTSFRIDQLLPPSLAGELEQGTLTVQPLFTGARWFGVMLHEQTTLDRHTGEALRLDASRVLDTITRARELTERADELEKLVAVRTEQLEQEVATRRAAQEDLREANEGLRRALLLDGLTGLNNRPSFDEHLNRAWHRHLRGGGPLSLLMIDVDHFKLYNDTYGHLAGDDCLRRVAACLQAAITRNQDVVARFGGEEFAVVLPDTGPDGARQVAQRLLERMRAAAIPHTGVGRRVSVSIGLATTETVDVDSPLSLLALADQALYQAKQQGRDRAVEG